jgi:hypothetical protein
MSQDNPSQTKTFHGSCHCGAVRYEVDLDLSTPTSRCNCSICTKTSMWGVIVKPEAFRVLSGEDNLSDYQRGPKVGHFLFCKTCGVRSFGRGDAPWVGGPYVSINLNCLDGVDLDEVIVNHYDGRNNSWSTPRTEKHPLKTAPPPWAAEG